MRREGDSWESCTWRVHICSGLGISDTPQRYIIANASATRPRRMLISPYKWAQEDESNSVADPVNTVLLENTQVQSPYPFSLSKLLFVPEN